MNRDVKARWIKALRSGEYKQGTGKLKSKQNDFCCLGVLCDLHSKETGEDWIDNLYHTGTLTYRGENGNLNQDVLDWAELTLEENATLIDMNDNDRYTFPEIAKFIERYR